MSACRDLAYSEFGRRIARAAAGRRLPLSGSIELTFKCNLRCVHCYIPDFSGRDEMGTAEIVRIMDEIADAGCLWLLLTGGEVLTRRDFAVLYRHAKRRGFLVAVFSNGTLFDERVADLFAEWPPFSLEFTLYGLSDATYLRTTGFPGRFTLVRRAIELAIERQIPLALKAVAMEPLLEEIPRMQAYAAGLGLPFRYDPTIHGRLDGGDQPIRARAAAERAVRFDLDDPRRRAEWREFHRGFVERPAPRDGLLLSCGAGINSFHVDPRGRLLSCEALPVNAYDLRHGNFLAGWNGPLADLRRRPADPANVCARCDLRAMCDRCPATATLETGSPDGWIPWYCEVTHRRAAILEAEAGRPGTAARLRAHADRVAAGWVPEGAILPRPAAGAGSCATGGCSTTCGAGATMTARPLQIEAPPRAA
jgi:radical SAM protein with 4Fe4S-binding SPASM domain